MDQDNFTYKLVLLGEKVFPSALALLLETPYSFSRLAAGPTNGDGANPRAERLETYRFTSSEGVVSDFNKFSVLGMPATRHVDG